MVFSESVNYAPSIRTKKRGLSRIRDLRLKIASGGETVAVPRVLKDPKVK